MNAIDIYDEALKLKLDEQLHLNPALQKAKTDANAYFARHKNKAGEKTLELSLQALSIAHATSRKKYSTEDKRNAEQHKSVIVPSPHHSVGSEPPQVPLKPGDRVELSISTQPKEIQTAPEAITEAKEETATTIIFHPKIASSPHTASEISSNNTISGEHLDDIISFNDLPSTDLLTYGVGSIFNALHSADPKLYNYEVAEAEDHSWLNVMRQDHEVITATKIDEHKYSATHDGEMLTWAATMKGASISGAKIFSFNLPEETLNFAQNFLIAILYVFKDPSKCNLTFRLNDEITKSLVLQALADPTLATNHKYDEASMEKLRNMFGVTLKDRKLEKIEILPESIPNLNQSVFSNKDVKSANSRHLPHKRKS